MADEMKHTPPHTHPTQPEQEADQIAHTIKAALNETLYTDPDGTYHITQQPTQQLTPHTLQQWAKNQLETECLYNKNGTPTKVSVLIGYGGPTIYTEDDELIWSHGQSKSVRYIPGLHDALLDLQVPLKLVSQSMFR